jgi:homoserine kinase
MKLTIRIPATTANLGPGFDCLGLALDWWNTLVVEDIPRGIEVLLRGTYAEGLPRDESNLVVQTMFDLFARAKRKARRGLRITMTNEIPVGRGLGSSAAAIVGGLLAANGLLEDRFTREELVNLATVIEGHPDNVTAALSGGLVVMTREAERVVFTRVKVVPGLRAVVFVPEHALSTKLARDILPKEVSRADAVFNIGRAAMLVSALRDGKWELLDAATRDRLHQPYRARLVPGMEEVFVAAREAGARGVALSGAGPSVLAFTDARFERIARAMERSAQAAGVNGHARVLKISARGAYVARR